MSPITGICVIPNGDKQPPATHGHICDTCYQKLEHILSQILRRINWLHANLKPTSRPGQRVSGTPEPAAPLNVAIIDMIDDITGKLWSWLRTVAQHQGHDRQPSPPELEHIVAALQHALPWIATQPWVDEFFTELETAWLDAHKMRPVEPSRRHLDVPCPRCHRLTLFQRAPEELAKDREHYQDQPIQCLTVVGGCGANYQVGEDEHDRNGFAWRTRVLAYGEVARVTGETMTEARYEQLREQVTADALRQRLEAERAERAQRRQEAAGE